MLVEDNIHVKNTRADQRRYYPRLSQAAAPAPVTLIPPCREFIESSISRLHIRHYRPEIDGLRAVAILPVLFFHAGLGFPGG